MALRSSFLLFFVPVSVTVRNELKAWKLPVRLDLFNPHRGLWGCALSHYVSAESQGEDQHAAISSVLHLPRFKTNRVTRPLTCHGCFISLTRVWQTCGHCPVCCFPKRRQHSSLPQGLFFSPGFYIILKNSSLTPQHCLTRFVAQNLTITLLHIPATCGRTTDTPLLYVWYLLNFNCNLWHMYVCDF